MLEQGQRVGPYEIRAFVGQGGMGQVYEAYDPRLERKVALKVIQVPADAEPQRSDSGHLVTDFAARLLREARAVAALNHHNVVNIYDVGEDDGRLFLAMEFVVGHTLRALVGQPVPVERKVRWLVDVARALEAAHRAGIIHRDVKPENVIVREDGVVKVLDFGIARRTVAPTDDQKRVETITGGGGIAGTPVYMAPEQIRGHELDARADQFAWGVTAYELLSGARPWSDQGEVLAIVARILTDPHPPLEERAEGVPKVVAKTVSRTLEKRPDDRFPSMADVADAIEPYAATTTHRDRVIVSPRREDPSAFAATTRIPTTLEVEEKETTTLESAKRESRPPPRRAALVRLAVPLALLGALAGGVYVVRVRRGPRVVQTARPVSEVPEAVTAFEDAQRLLRDGAEARGLAELERALTLDPALASAHLELAILTYSTDPTSARAHYQSAFQHRDRLSDRDFALLEAAEAFVSAHDMAEWETRLMRATLRFPNDTQLQYFLGDARVRQANDAGAKSAFEAAVKSDPAFVPALAELANVKKRMGDAQGALEVAEECLRRSPVASVCIAARTRVLSATGACGEAREAAARWITLEPTSHEALGAHASALFATGAPRPAIEEVLARRWGTFPEGRRHAEELYDRVWLAVADGKFDEAAARAEELAKALAPTADAYDHARPARLRVAVLTESGKQAEAAKVARDYLDRLPAWASYDFAPDPSIAFYEPLYRAGRLSRPELDRAREAWLAAEDARVKGDPRTRDKLAWLRWSHVWGGFAETRAEALEALERAPETPSEVGRRGQAFDFDLGKVELLAGRVIDAVPHLKKAVSGCASLTDSMVHTRARLYLGRALEAQGDREAARREYERVVSLWGKATPASVTAREAAERLKRL